MATNKSYCVLFNLLRYFIFFPLIALSIIAGLPNSVLCADISGTISLPPGHSAPIGGITIWIHTLDANSDQSAGEHITILEGNSSESYSVTVPDDITAAWRVRYGYSGNDFIGVGYYASSGTTWDSDDATLLPGGENHSGIDMTLLTGNLIAGIVSLPSGTAPAGGVRITIHIDNVNSSGRALKIITIPENSSSTTYSITIPEIKTSWRVIYNSHDSDYLPVGYYTSSGTTWDWSAATRLPGMEDHSDIDMTLLTGPTITGTISLPSGAAPVGGISIYLNAVQDNGTFSANIRFSILEGHSSAAYTIMVPKIKASFWRVQYSCVDSNYLRAGYYASSGTTWNRDAATLLSGDENHSDINMNLLTGNIIAGTVFLPSGTAPAGGIEFKTYASDPNSGWQDYGQVTIPEGSSSETYSRRVPDDASASWRVYYYYSGNDYLQMGYYTSSGTTGDMNAATMLPGGEDHSGINMTLLRTTTSSIFPWSMFLPAIIGTQRH